MRFVPVHGGGAEVHEATYARARGLGQQGAGAFGVDRPALFLRAADAGREVDDGGDAVADPAQRGRVGEIAGHRLDGRCAAVAVAGGGAVVGQQPQHGGVRAGGAQPLCHVGADEAGAARHEDPFGYQRQPFAGELGVDDRGTGMCPGPVIPHPAHADHLAVRK
ncbi:hypothetical protein GCM10010347_61560 [Streptomyces cirratus]|uniref:Uncharacterized protein n=1 Tax=Streptomyces cirratus TaxID=68187 RepID=A0ABQ3F1L3_9ACTN|nr:hypothetical protein GCM10010347_61560 [Streptomyces cirratus]